MMSGPPGSGPPRAPVTVFWPNASGPRFGGLSRGMGWLSKSPDIDSTYARLPYAVPASARLSRMDLRMCLIGIMWGRSPSLHLSVVGSKLPSPGAECKKYLDNGQP